METERVFLALGSNLGDREAHLTLARTRVDEVPRTRVLAASRVEETVPLGPVTQPPFLNQMLLIETRLEPLALLDACRAIEREAGRVRRERWGPRTLDIDIVQFGTRRIDSPRLTVPHPELPNRDFWRREMQEVVGVE